MPLESEESKQVSTHSGAAVMEAVEETGNSAFTLPYEGPQVVKCHSPSVKIISRVIKSQTEPYLRCPQTAVRAALSDSELSLQYSRNNTGSIDVTLSALLKPLSIFQCMYPCHFSDDDGPGYLDVDMVNLLDDDFQIMTNIRKLSDTTRDKLIFTVCSLLSI